MVGQQQPPHEPIVDMNAMQLLPRHRYILQMVDAAFGIYNEDLTEVMFLQDGVIDKVQQSCATARWRIQVCTCGSSFEKLNAVPSRATPGISSLQIVHLRGYAS